MPTTRGTDRLWTDTTWSGRLKPIDYITLLTGTYDDWLEYILTDESDNAIYVKDNTGYEISSTERSERTAI